MEFREINTSFSAVGAFAAGEVNLTAGDRPLRVRSALVDDHLLRALGVQAALGRLFGLARCRDRRRLPDNRC